MNEPSLPTPPSTPSGPDAAAPRFCTRCGAPLPQEGSCAACILQRARSTGSERGSGAFVPRTVEAMNAALPAYECQVLVGQGGMGAVYRARHRKLDRLVAIKVLRPTAVEDDSASFAERFEREARVLAKLDHPHIVRIYDFGRTEGREEGDKGFFFLVLEYVDGASLRDLMRDGRLTAREALELIPQVCEALQTAHALGVVHRDIKPENILVDSEGRVRIADFGLAKLSNAEPTGFGLTHTNQTFGTLHYMAPEQMRGAATVDHRADLYSLGVVLYEMLTGELPLGRFVAPSAKTGEAKDLDGVVFRALENEPDARYQEADELKRDLVAGGHAPPVLTRRQRHARRKARTAGSPKPDVTRRSQPADSNAGSPPSRTNSSSSQSPTSPRDARANGSRWDPNSPAAMQPLIRSWTGFALLVLLYGTFWLEFEPSDLTHYVHGFHELETSAPYSEWGTIKTGPYSIKVAGVPLWLGLVASAGAATLRTVISSGRAISGWIPTALNLFGLGLLLVLLVSCFVTAQLHLLMTGFAFALLTHGWVAFADLQSHRTRRL